MRFVYVKTLCSKITADLYSGSGYSHLKLNGTLVQFAENKRSRLSDIRLQCAWAKQAFVDVTVLFLNKEFCWVGTVHDSSIQKLRLYYVLLQQN